jgi:signal peptidase I
MAALDSSPSHPPFSADPAEGMEHSDCCERVTAALRRRGVTWVKVSGKSMAPWIRPGDVLFVRRAGMGRASPGQVVLFARGGRLIVHRVIGRLRVAGRVFLETKGDATWDADAPISETELLGRATQIFRAGRSIALETPHQAALGRLLACISPARRLWHPLARAAKRFATGA